MYNCIALHDIVLHRKTPTMLYQMPVHAVSNVTSIPPSWGVHIQSFTSQVGNKQEIWADSLLLRTRLDTWWWFVDMPLLRGTDCNDRLVYILARTHTYLHTHKCDFEHCPPNAIYPLGALPTLANTRIHIITTVEIDRGFRAIGYGLRYATQCAVNVTIHLISISRFIQLIMA